MLRAVLLLCLLSGLAAAQPAGEGGGAADPSFGRDYQPTHKGWNGLSELAALAGELRCPLEPRTVLDWEGLSGRDVLWVLYPETALDEEALTGYLAVGGRLVLADDHGRGEGALRRLGVRRRPPPAPWPAGVSRYRDNDALPIAVPVRATSLGQGSRELITNHPVLLGGLVPATYAFLPQPDGDFGLVLEGSLGRGRFVAIGDPSVFINNMVQVPGNREFAARLVLELCRPGEDRLLLLHGPFGQRGAPPAVLLGAPSSGGAGELPDRWNRAFGGANLHIQEVLGGGNLWGMNAALLSGVVLALAALLLGLRYLPLAVAPHDASFAQAPRPEGSVQGLSSLPALIERYRRSDVPWGYMYPAVLLREEVLRRLALLPLELPRPLRELSARELEQALRARVSPEAGRAGAVLWRALRGISEPGGDSAAAGSVWVSERTLARLHQLAKALLQLLPEPAPRRGHE